MSGLPEPGTLPQVAVASMNRTHDEELALVRRLAALLHDGASDDALDRALDAWLAHTEAHFERENRLMETHGFPPYPIHADEHARVLDELRRQRESWQESRDREALRRYVEETWPQWFLHHLATMDQVTAQFLSAFVE